MSKVRIASAVIAAPLIWGVFNVAGNQLMFALYPEALEGSTPMPYLLGALTLSFVYSVVSGAISALIAKETTWIGLGAGIALFAVGLPMQLAFWDALPVWWHLVFLASLIPLAMLGAKLVQSRASAAPTEQAE